MKENIPLKQLKTTSVHVYILKLSDGRHYTGITNNMARRLMEHCKGESITTRKFRPVILIHIQTLADRKEARKKEVYIKNMGAKKYLNKLRFEPQY